MNNIFVKRKVVFMKLDELLLGVTDCKCGKKHLCPIDFVEIGKNAISKLPEMCKGYSHILLVSDGNTYKVCGKNVFVLLKDKVESNLILNENGELVIPNENSISLIESKITAETDLIIGVGSGVINDLCKYVSYKNDLYYYIVATATSMDGYASVGSALILEDMKVTLNARPPKAIVADTTVLKDAPMEMLQAGYGDIVGKYSCLNDWKLSALINNEYFCQMVYDLTYESAENVKKLADGVVKRDEETVGALMEALVVVGIAMSYVDCSRPASGSEHHLSHFFEITGILNNERYFAHGIDVAYSAVVTSKLRDKIIALKPERKAFKIEIWEREIKRVYTEAADGVINLQNKLGWYEKDDSLIIKEKWNEIAEILNEAPKAEEFIEMLEKVKLDFEKFTELYGEDKINDAILYAKDLKDRYSVLWLNYLYF